MKYVDGLRLDIGSTKKLICNAPCLAKTGQKRAVYGSRVVPGGEEIISVSKRSNNNKNNSCWYIAQRDTLVCKNISVFGIRVQL